MCTYIPVRVHMGFTVFFPYIILIFEFESDWFNELTIRLIKYKIFLLMIFIHFIFKMLLKKEGKKPIN